MFIKGMNDMDLGKRVVQAEKWETLQPERKAVHNLRDLNTGKIPSLELLSRIIVEGGQQYSLPLPTCGGPLRLIKC